MSSYYDQMEQISRLKRNWLEPDYEYERLNDLLMEYDEKLMQLRQTKENIASYFTAYRKSMKAKAHLEYDLSDIKMQLQERGYFNV